MNKTKGKPSRDGGQPTPRRLLDVDNVDLYGWSIGELYSEYQQNPEFPRPVSNPGCNPRSWSWDRDEFEAYLRKKGLWT